MAEKQEIPRRSEQEGVPAEQLHELSRKVQELTRELQEARLESERYRERLQSRQQELRRGRKAQEEIRAISEQLERQAMLAEKDRDVIRALQSSLAPVWLSDFEGIEFSLQSVPGSRIAGDFYDVVRLSDSTLAFTIADVSGCGLPAVVIMATARMAFRTFAGRDVSPRKIMQNVNDALLHSTLAGHYLTAFTGVLDAEMLTLQFTNASHCCPYLIRGNEMIPLDTEGLLVGMLEQPQYEEKCIELEPNDKLFLFTDGLLRELRGGEGENGTKRLRALLEKHADMGIEELGRRLLEEILQRPKDDVVLMGLEILRRKAKQKTVVIPSIPGEIVRVEDTILPILSAKGYGERTLFSVRLALEEAVINAIKHGNELDNTKRVTIDFAVNDDNFSVSVTDEGEGFNPDAVPDPWSEQGLEQDSGRGLALMRAYMDEVAFNEKGNKVTMIKNAPWAAKKS